MTTKLSAIKHEHHEIDATGQVLGRLATKVATLLVGKNKPYFVRHLDCGDFVTVKNIKGIIVTGKKLEKKTYTHYSGYPAGLKKTAMENLLKKDSGAVLHHAVFGMLPNNKLRSRWIKRLKIEN